VAPFNSAHPVVSFCLQRQECRIKWQNFTASDSSFCTFCRSLILLSFKLRLSKLGTDDKVLNLLLKDKFNLMQFATITVKCTLSVHGNNFILVFLSSTFISNVTVTWTGDYFWSSKPSSYITRPVPILSVFPALIVHSELKCAPRIASGIYFLSTS